jgi:hypothetical protein
MTHLSPPRHSHRPKPSTGARIAGIVYAAIPITVAAVVVLGSFL